MKSIPSIKSVKSFVADYLVAEVFLALTIVSIPLSQYSGMFILQEILNRIARNAFLVFSLVLPIMAGTPMNTPAASYSPESLPDTVSMLFSSLSMALTILVRAMPMP